LALPHVTLYRGGMAGPNEPPTLTTFDGHEIYPMPMFPTNPAPDPEQAARLRSMFDDARPASE
jgi:hypothetical protein